MAREIPNQVRGLIGFLFNQSSIQAFNTILSEANNALVSRKLFKNQIGNFQIVWPYMSHLLNFLDLEYKEYLDKTFKFLKVLPSTSEAEANRFKNIALDVSFYVYDEKKVFITTPAWEMFFFMYLLFLYGIYFSFGIYHFGNGYDYRDFAREIQEPYEHFIRECVEYYYSDKIDIDFKGLFYKNFLADPELIQLFFDTIRNSYKEGQEFVLQRSEEDVRKFLNKHIMDSCLDWMGGFENLERFFLNSMLGQYIKMMVASDHDASDEKNFKFYEFGVNQKKVIDQVKNEQGVENLEDYFYFY